MASNRIVTPVSTPEQRIETNTSSATVETDRAIRLALAAQRREMQKALEATR
jgi:hypothetical protein